MIKILHESTNSEIIKNTANEFMQMIDNLFNFKLVWNQVASGKNLTQEFRARIITSNIMIGYHLDNDSNSKFYIGLSASEDETKGKYFNISDLDDLESIKSECTTYLTRLVTDFYNVK